MPYANIGQIALANTFDHWRIVTNQLSNAVNQIAGNTIYTKDDGSWVLTRGSITLSNTEGTVLTVSANATISKILTVTDIVLTGNISGGGSFPQSNAAYRQANLAYSTANSAYGVANLGFTAANTAANTARVSANGASTLSAQQLNFVNSPTVTVSIVAGTGAAAGTANISFTAISSGASAADAYTQANVAYTVANAAYGTANSGYGVANLAYGTANLAYGTANTGYGQANSAFTAANNAANTVQVYANSSLIVSKANLNFVNSTNIIVSAVNNSGQANVGFAVNTAAITSVGTLTALDISGSAANIFDTPIVSVTSSGSYADNAAGKILLCDSTSPTAITLTFHSAPKANFSVTIIRNGTGNVIIANTTSVQKQNTTSYTTANISTQFGAATVVYTATNKFILLGDIT